MSDDIPVAVRRAIPTLEAAREQGIELPASEPTETLRLAALRVVIHAQFRKTWRDEVTVPGGAVAAMADRDPPPADVPSAQHMVAERIGARHGCPRCNGEGRVTVTVIQAKHRMLCPDCKGSGDLADVHVRRLVDTMERLGDAILPTLIRNAPGLLHLERVVESILPEQPQDAFECQDLRPVAQTSAYRGATRQQAPVFHGFDFGDGIDLAKKAIDHFLEGKGKLLRYRVRAWGWPLLWLRWCEPPPDPTVVEVVLVADPAGKLTAIRPQPQVKG